MKHSLKLQDGTVLSLAMIGCDRDSSHWSFTARIPRHTLSRMKRDVILKSAKDSMIIDPA
jgi:hypothetical protein